MADTSLDQNASADQPANDIESLKAQFEERIKGLQTAMNQKVQEAQDATRRLAELEEERVTAGLSEDEKVKRLNQRAAKEMAQLRAENELLKLSQKFPEEVPVLQRMFGAKTVEDQLAAMAEFKANLLKKADPGSGGVPAPADVDPNNPMRTMPDVQMVDGQPMTADLADRILKAAGPGSLFKR